MGTRIYYFSATGNSLAVARQLAEHIDDCQLVSIPNVFNDETPITGDTIGIVSPCYMYNMPHMVADFIKKIKKANYIFFAYSGAGQVGEGISIVKKRFAEQNLEVSAIFNIPMPDNYTPYGCPPMEKQKELFDNAAQRIPQVTEIIKNKSQHIDHHNTSWFRYHIHPAIFYRMGHQRISTLDSGYSVDEKCNGCGICQKVCPANNITMTDQKPTWNHRCQLCYACLQWCPQESIQAGKKTVGIKRYHHPTINVKEIINGSPS